MSIFGLLESVTNLAVNVVDIAITPLEIGVAIVNIPAGAVADCLNEVAKDIREEAE